MVDEVVLNKLKILREFLNMNQGEFASILGVSQPSYSRIEAGKSEICADALRVLFHEKGVSPLWFFYDIDPIIFPFEDGIEKNKLSQLLKKELLFEKILKKILIEKEKNMWGYIFGVDHRLKKALLVALSQDFNAIQLTEAKSSLVNAVRNVQVPLLNTPNVFDSDKKKLIEIIEELKDLEAFTILQNAKEIISTIDFIDI